MMIVFKEIRESLLQLFFPHVCAGCGSDTLRKESSLCLRCLHSLPATNFEKHANNPVEKLFWGRLPLVEATAQYYFNKESLMQDLMHEFKYKGNQDLGLQLGMLMGECLTKTNRFQVDGLIALPLFVSKEKKRGYNQAEILCRGMALRMHVPVLKNVVARSQHTDTQTKKGRIERWKNMEGKFILAKPELVYARHILLVDDVITTGATLEACGNEILQGKDVRLSVACLCIAAR